MLLPLLIVAGWMLFGLIAARVAFVYDAKRGNWKPNDPGDTYVLMAVFFLTWPAILIAGIVWGIGKLLTMKPPRSKKTKV